MLINKEVVHTHDINLDKFTSLHIAEKRVDGKIMVMAEFRGICCPIREFAMVRELIEHYHINNPDLQDSILRIVEFIGGNL